MKTALLDTIAWDFVLDANGDLAMASDPYSIAQDVCSAIRTFLGEVWFNTTLGVPYLTQILGRFPPASLIKAQLQAAALGVPGVTAATVYLGDVVNRALTGQVQITYSDPTSPTAPSLAVIEFFGTNSGYVTFIGDNNAAVSFGA